MNVEPYDHYKYQYILDIYSEKNKAPYYSCSMSYYQFIITYCMVFFPIVKN